MPSLAIETNGADVVTSEFALGVTLWTLAEVSLLWHIVPLSYCGMFRLP